MQFNGNQSEIPIGSVEAEPYPPDYVAPANVARHWLRVSLDVAHMWHATQLHFR